MSWPWSELGLSGPADLPTIRHAYAQRLKTTHPEEDPAGFQRLHNAYQLACQLARRAKSAPPTPAEPEESESEAAYEEDDSEDAGWDFDPLFEDDMPPQRAAEPETASDDWDFARSAEADATPENAPQTDWDFERLFAEGKAEEDEALRRKAEERRQKNRERLAKQERAQRAHATAEERAWAAASAALHALELLYSNDATPRIWKEFLSSETFWNAKANLDFVFGLEDFLELHPDLPEEIRRAIFLAYGFDSAAIQEIYRPLYRLLNLSLQDQRQLRRANSRWRKLPRRRQVATVIGVAWLGLLCLLAFVLPFFEEKEEPAPLWQDQVCAWLEEDYGGHFAHPYDELAYSYIFISTDHPDVQFFASLEGTRDLAHGQRGYQTNYPDALVMAALEEFAAQQEIELIFDSAGGFRDTPGETPGAYIFNLPLTGAGEAIDALGAELDRLTRQAWYRLSPPEFQVQLCFHRLSFYDMTSTRGSFDTDYARSRYENQFGPQLCRFLAEESGAAEHDLGADSYVLMERGTVTLEGEEFFWVSALEKPPSNTELAQYFLSTDGKMLFCMPADIIGQPLTLEDLYQVSARFATVPTVGRDAITVTIWDHLRINEAL